MPIIAKYYDVGMNRWIKAYIRNIKFGSKSITIDMNIGTGYSETKFSPKEFYNEIKIQKEFTSSVPPTF